MGETPTISRAVALTDQQSIRGLLDDYLKKYATRDDRLTSLFSADFSGFTGGGDFLVKDRDSWVAITRQDFAQVRDHLRLELKDVALQSLAETVVVATSFFTIHLPIKDHVLSRETARLVLVFRKEAAGWRISHSSISIPYHLVREGEVYPMKEVTNRTQILERLVDQRTAQLHEANAVLEREIAERKQTEAALKKAVTEIKTLQGLLPICMHCKMIRDDRGHWSPVEVYVGERTGAEFSHGICPRCLETHYPAP
jgi:ketosteroid isomerase-like protein